MRRLERAKLAGAAGREFAMTADKRHEMLRRGAGDELGEAAGELALAMKVERLLHTTRTKTTTTG